MQLKVDEFNLRSQQLGAQWFLGGQRVVLAVPAPLWILQGAAATAPSCPVTLPNDRVLPEGYTCLPKPGQLRTVDTGMQKTSSLASR